MNEYTFAEIRKHVGKAGVKVYAQVRVTYDDVVHVEVKKADFLRQIRTWDADKIASCCWIEDDGSVTVG